MFSLLILHQGFHYDAETWCNRFCCTSETIKQFCSCCLRPPSTRPVKQLFLLPHIFSKAMARMSLFVLAMVAFIALIQILNLSQAFDINVGRAWMIGAGLSFIVMFILSQRKFQPDGVMAFCRSMGVPEVEELMFSYSWKIQEDAIRTLAKAVWSTGVGVWIDVAKLCPGDEIRPVVRSMVRSVYKCVVFISTEYIKSPNCCVEFWEAAQYPEKLIICVLDKLPDDVQAYLDKLVLPEQMVHSLEEVIPLLNQHINDDKDMAAYEWWKNQAIAGGGVPSHVAPNDAGDNAWTLPMFQLWGRVFIPTRSLSVGPAYLSGDCVEHGLQSRWPWLLIITFIGLAINGIDIYLKVFQADIKRTGLDYAWLILLFICDLAPLVAWSRLFDTRVLCDAALRPLMASRSLKGGVQIRINGKDDDPVVKCLRDFLRMLGHLAEPKSERRITVSGQEDEVDRVITVEVMNSKEHRDALFSDDEFPFDIRKTLFIWSGASDPFGKNDPAGSRMMRFLVLVKEWEKENLAESLFSAIGMRVVDVLHAKGD